MLNKFKNGHTMKFLLSAFTAVLCMIGSKAHAEYLHIHYEGTITSIPIYGGVMGFGFTEENTDGYQVGDPISGTLTIDIDIAHSFRPATPIFYGMPSYYNQPDPRFDNQQIMYKNYTDDLKDDQHSEVQAIVGASQQFIVGGFNKEPSSINYDSIVMYNGTDRTDTTDPAQLIDRIQITNHDLIGDTFSAFNHVPVQHTMKLNIIGKTADFLDSIELNQSFSLSGDEFEGLGSYLVNTNVHQSERDYIKVLPDYGHLKFELNSVVGEVSNYPHIDCRVCE